MKGKLQRIETLEAAIHGLMRCRIDVFSFILIFLAHPYVYVLNPRPSDGRTLVEFVLHDLLP